MTGRCLIFVSYYYPPSTQMAARRARQIVEYLLGTGWTVVVVTAGNADETETTAESRLRVVRVRDPLARVTTRAQATDSTAPVSGGWKAAVIRLGRVAVPFDSSLFWCLRAVRQARPHLRNQAPVCVLTSAPPLATVLAGARLRAAEKNVVWVHELRDLVSTNPIYAWGRLRRWINFRLEKWLLRRADGLVFLTEAIADEYRQLYRVAAPGAVIYNGFDPEFAARIKPLSPMIPGQLRLLHVGSFYGSRNPLALLAGLRRAMDKCSELAAGVRLILVGQLGQNSAEITMVHEQIRSLRLSEVVQILPPLPHEQLIELYNAAEVLVLVTHADGSSQYAIPGKLFEYIGAGRKILAVTSDPLPERLIEANDLGWVCPHQELSIGDRILKIFNDRRGRQSTSLAEERIQQFSFARQVARLEAIMKAPLRPL